MPRRRKRQAVFARAALSNVAIIDRVVLHVGLGQWLVIGAIDRQWQRRYKAQRYPQLMGCVEKDWQSSVKERVTHQHSYYNAAVTSVSRFRLAVSMGLDLDSEEWVSVAHHLATASDAVLKVALQMGLSHTNEELLQTVSESGDLSRLKALLTHAEKGFVLPFPDMHTIAAKCGNAELLKYLYNRWALEVNNLTLLEAARSGSLELVKWLYAKGCPILSDVYSSAAEIGHMPILRWLDEKECSYSLHIVTRDAARGGQVPVLQYLESKGAKCDSEVLTAAAESGKLYVVEYVAEQGAAVTAACVEAAAKGGHASILRYLHRASNEGTDSWDMQQIVELTAGSRSVECMRFVMALPGAAAQLSDDLTMHAMGNEDTKTLGSLDMLTYLHLEWKCPISIETARATADHSGCMPIMQFMWEHGVEWQLIDLLKGEDTFWACDKFLEWLHDEKGVRWPAGEMTEMLNLCGNYGSTEGAEWLIEHGTRFPAVLQARDTENQDRLVPWSNCVIKIARKHGCTSAELSC